MTDDEIRDALLAARGGFAPYSVVDYLVVSRDRVVGDLEEIDRWVQDHDGRIETQPGYPSQALGGGRWELGPSTDPSQWYVVPASALGL